MVTSSKNRTADENKVFYAEGLEKLRAEPLAESSGKLILDLLNAQAEKVLIPFARNWIKKYPNHEVAPRLAGKLLRHFDTNDAMYMSISYMKTYPDVKALNQIVSAAAHLGGSDQKLMDAIERRMAKDPNSHIWGFLQAKDQHNESINALLCSWLNQNPFDEDIVGSLTSVALYTDSSPVLEACLKWTEKNEAGPEKKYMWMLFMMFFMGGSPAHAKILPRVIDYARGWLRRNSDDEYCGTVYCDVIYATKSMDDIRSAKAWYLNNSSTKTSVKVLSAIIWTMHKIGEAPDKEIVALAKKRLVEDTDLDHRKLSKCLLLACPDEETIEYSRRALKRTSDPLLHAALLSVSPDEELLKEAIHALPSITYGVFELTVSVLRIDPGNEVARSAAESWMRNNPDHEQVKELTDLLSK